MKITNKRAAGKAFAVSMLCAAMSATAFADGLVGMEQDIEAGSVAPKVDEDMIAVRNMAQRIGISLRPEEIRQVLERYPQAVQALEPEREADLQAAVIESPARFEVTGRSIIADDDNFIGTDKYAGGRFTSTDGVDLLLNYRYTGVLGGYMAVKGSADDGNILGELALDSGLSKIGVYGAAYSTGAVGGYGVYGTTNQITGYGIYASNTAPRGDSSTTGGGVALWATGDIDGYYTEEEFNHLDNHVAVIENSSTQGTHVLALSMPNDSNSSAADNFITFYHGGSTAADAQGSIEGVIGGGVNYNTSSADFAEWIPRRDAAERLEAGDIVGITEGRVSRDLRGVDHVQVISTAPAFTGNDPGYDKRDQYALVSMLGQVPVKVAGVVRAGDYIVASDRNDGTGVAIPADNMTPDDYRRMVGRAWESSGEQGMKLINTAVGLDSDGAYAYMKKQDQRIASLEQQLSSKMASLERLAAQLESLTRKVAYIQAGNMTVSAAR